ncbi:LamB/YcsF family protein [Schlesneria sp. DSM 10557]|uniref:LamB/YcsF family protein n=1 Tax=Schlesneria sp. DSM 10557 TaxID=3044399 RepID=UPI0035A0B457
MKRLVDLNCDIGESFGAYSMGQDAEVLEFVTSASIACGFHAGDPATMRRTVRLALEKGVAIGAHPGLPDLVGFGRRAMKITPQEASDLVTYQVGALAAFVTAEGGTMQHVKPHGALYNMAARDPALADALAQAIRSVNPGLILFGQSGSELIAAGLRAGLRTASEVFADRSYEEDGSLTPRDLPGAVIADAETAVRQVLTMLQSGTVTSRQGTTVPVDAETICLHGDSPETLEFTRRIRNSLEAAGITVSAFSSARN